MANDKGMRNLALSVFAQALSDRNAAIHYFSTSMSVQVRTAYVTALKRKRENIEAAGGNIHFDKEAMLEKTRKFILDKRREARTTIIETTHFLVNPSLWHDILGVHPDAIRKRIEENDIDLRRKAA